MANRRLQQIIGDVAPPQANGGGASDLGQLIRSLAPTSGENVPDVIASASRQVEQLRTVNQTQTDLVTQNTEALTQNTSAQSGGKGAASALGEAASGFLSSTLSFLPVVSGLLKIFGL